MSKPEFITFTGLDDRTDLARAHELAEKYRIEWGLLFSKTNKDARYPSAQTFLEASLIDGYKSVHLCGSASRTFVKEFTFPKEVEPIVHRLNRVQVNGAKGLYVSVVDGVAVITQCREFSDRPCNAELFDVSGGRGEMPESIPVPKSDHLVGYAGGMGPETVEAYLEMITCENPFWIDMESKVRTDGWFDLDKVERVCQIVYGEV